MQLHLSFLRKPDLSYDRLAQLLRRRHADTVRMRLNDEFHTCMYICILKDKFIDIGIHAHVHVHVCVCVC